MPTQLRFHVEGNNELRAAFISFFRKALPNCRQPEIVMYGSRFDAVDDFNYALEHPEANVQDILLVDLEGAFDAKLSVKDNLQRSLMQGTIRGNAFLVTAQADDERIFLMVQCMENWFVADEAALANFYAQGFKVTALPKRSNIEEVSKLDVFTSLKEAARRTTKKTYDKSRHAPLILRSINPKIVTAHAPQLQRLLDKLTQQLCD